ncbi:MAG: SdrD B-like domain-containing protein [Anaerolineae bacterium]
MKHRSFLAVLLSLLFALALVAGVRAEPIVPGDGIASGSPQVEQTLADATGCVDSTSNWLGQGQNVSTNSGTHWAGVIFVHIPPGDPAMTPTFCTDLGTTIGQGKCFVADGPTACPITWLLNNGYGPGNPASNAEAAARQAAVWHFSDALVVSSSDPVYARTQEIIAAVPDPCVLPQSAPVMTLEPASAINFLPGGEVHSMTVTVTQDGAPLAGRVVNLSTTFGTLSSSTVTTGPDGTASFTLTSNVTGSATVTASFAYTLPAGTRMVKLPGQADQQVIVLGTPQSGNVIAVASKVWQTGTMIIVHKFSDNNTNGIQDGGEESLQGWSMKLVRWTGSAWQLVSTKSTDAAGNAIFTNLSPGTYRAEETLQSGWTNTTPNPSAEVTLAAGGQATINFGNVALAVIKAWKFYDLNMDGVHDANEPLLDGWQMNIFPAINGIGSGLTAGGAYSFIDLPPGSYRVWETQQPGWIATTPVEVTLALAANDFREVWFGNVQMDLGDLPTDGTAGVPYPVHYPTLLAQDGARHVIHDIQLGPAITAETDGKPCPVCGLDLDDGVTALNLPWTAGVGGGAVAVQVSAIGSTSITTGYVNAWIDWNQNGQFDAGEQILVDAPVPVGTTQVLTFDIPGTQWQLADFYYARFRLYETPQNTCLALPDNLQCNPAPTGLAVNGEVEDYRWDFHPLGVMLGAFNADPYGEGILVNWATVTEAGNASFNLYRAADPAGPQTLLSAIPSQAPGSTLGFAYSYVDLDVQAGQTYWYWLEDVSLSGATTLHGPVSATATAPTAVTLSSVSASPAAAAGWSWLWTLAGAGAALAIGRRRRA